MVSQIERLLTEMIDKVLAIGCFKDETGEVILLSDTLYIKFDSAYLKLEDYGTGAGLVLSVCKELDFEWIFEDTKPAHVDISNFVFEDSFVDCSVSSMVLYNVVEEEGSIRSDVLQLELDTGQTLFIDPCYLDGLNIGGRSKCEKWLGQFSDKDQPEVLRIVIH